MSVTNYAKPICTYILTFAAVICFVLFLYQLIDFIPKNSNASNLLTKSKPNQFADVSYAQIKNIIQQEEDDEGFLHPRYTREKMGNMAWQLLHLISVYSGETHDDQTIADLNQFLW